MKPFVSKPQRRFVFTNSSRGFSVLVVVLMISTLAFLIAFQTVITGLTEEQIRLRDRRARETFYLAQGCLEEMLFSLKQDPDYSGGSLVIGSVVCDVTVTGVETKTVTVRASREREYSSEMQAEVRLSPDFSVLRWRELPLAIY